MREEEEEAPSPVTIVRLHATISLRCLGAAGGSTRASR